VHLLYIVDTDASVREGLSRLAASAGFEARACESVETFLKEPAPDSGAACALVDLSDPGLRKAAIRQRLAALAGKLPVIAISARDDAQTQRTARELGARAFFRKPVDAAALLDSIGWVSHTPKTR
jgi:FixJ family two-component response regulator